MAGDPTFAMSFRTPEGDWWFIPTDPEARKWRGPYPTDVHMMRAAVSELGDEVIVTRTTVNGPHK